MPHHKIHFIGLFVVVWIFFFFLIWKAQFCPLVAQWKKYIRQLYTSRCVTLILCNNGTLIFQIFFMLFFSVDVVLHSCFTHSKDTHIGLKLTQNQIFFPPLVDLSDLVQLTGSLKRLGSSHPVSSHLRVLHSPLSSGLNPEGIYV